jgi:hypothetical protein
MKRKATKLGFFSLFLGLALASATFIKGFKADSLIDVMTGESALVKGAIIAGIILITFAVGCFVLAAAAEK